MKKQPPEPWLPVAYTAREAYAIQALAKGEATKEQQQLAYNWILYSAADVNQLSYRPGADGARDTAFAEGRRFVGLQLEKLNILSAEYLGKLKDG